MDWRNSKRISAWFGALPDFTDLSKVQCKRHAMKQWIFVTDEKLSKRSNFKWHRFLVSPPLCDSNVDFKEKYFNFIITVPWVKNCLAIKIAQLLNKTNKKQHKNHLRKIKLNFNLIVNKPEQSHLRKRSWKAAANLRPIIVDSE